MLDPGSWRAHAPCTCTVILSGACAALALVTTRCDCAGRECGDGILARGEACDDENRLPGDGCDETCQVEPGWRCTAEPSQCDTLCGDGLQAGAEACDSSDLGEASCASLGLGSGVLACAPDCTFDTAGCLGLDRCGNNTVDVGEACDGTDFAGQTCASVSGLLHGNLQCTASCELNLTDCHTCGDANLEAAEACDGTLLRGESCPSLTGLPHGNLVCTTDCVYDVSVCHDCGDGVIQGPEQCDGSNLGGADCTTLGQGGGELACGPACAFDLTDCTDCGNGQCELAKGESTVNCPADCGWTLLATGSYHTCGLKGDGTLWCWGRNAEGQLGLGNTTEHHQPVPVTTIAGVTRLAGSARSTCAAKADQTAWCWGANGTGQLGNGSTSQSLLPVPVSNATAVASISAGGINLDEAHTCALVGAGDVWCWGLSADGQLGDGGVIHQDCGGLACSLTPVLAQGAAAAEALAAGANHTCVVKGDQSVWCWGKNSVGQLGDGSLETRPLPVAVPGFTGAEDVWAGAFHTCARLASGQVWCWGMNLSGQLGNGSSAWWSASPVPVAGLSNVAQVALGYEHSCAVKQNGEVWCWGGNQYGQLGDGLSHQSCLGVDCSRYPVPVPTLTDAVALWARFNHTCALRQDGTAWCWGYGEYGRLGDGTTLRRDTPVAVIDPY